LVFVSCEGKKGPEVSYKDTQLIFYYKRPLILLSKISLFFTCYNLAGVEFTKLFCQAKSMAFGEKFAIQFHQHSASKYVAKFANFTT
jgi:hypothetical protein